MPRQPVEGQKCFAGNKRRRLRIFKPTLNREHLTNGFIINCKSESPVRKGILTGLLSNKKLCPDVIAK
jgi:hypothetical protein